MKYLEVSENLVLEGEMYKFDNFDFKKAITEVIFRF
jgi:hypothetical protein